MHESEKSESEVAQLCPTLATPWTAAYQAPPSMGFSRQEYWSGVPLPSHIVLKLPIFNHVILAYFSKISIRDIKSQLPNSLTDIYHELHIIMQSSNLFAVWTISSQVHKLTQSNCPWSPFLLIKSCHYQNKVTTKVFIQIKTSERSSLNIKWNKMFVNNFQLWIQLHATKSTF